MTELLGKMTVFCRVKNSFRGVLKIPSVEISPVTLGKHWAKLGKCNGILDLIPPAAECGS
jgi:hypothetical protein